MKIVTELLLGIKFHLCASEIPFKRFISNNYAINKPLLLYELKLFFIISLI